ncbi:MAG: PEP-CTERM sorting domain-containing protein [Cyanobacteriota bacterium]|nr:PEP-CTERM sorting domain-containing protein [Cyanobacteriota bacterium]
MNPFKTTSKVLGTITLLCGSIAAPAQAGNVFFGEYQIGDTVNEAAQAEQEFLVQFDDIFIEDFEGFNAGDAASRENPLTLNFEDSTATLTGGGAIRNADFAGLHAISGENYWSLTYAEKLQDTYEIAFNQAQAAFGFWATDMGDFRADFSLNFTYEDGTSELVDIPHTVGIGNGSELYFGYLSPDKLFTDVEFLTDGPIRKDGFGLDNVTIATRDQVKSVPEPASVLGLLVIGSFGFKSARKRQLAK